MKLSRYLFLSYVNLTRRKGGAALFILTLTLTLAALMTTLSLIEGWGDYYQRNYTDNLAYRRMFIKYYGTRYTDEERLALVKAQEHVLSASFGDGVAGLTLPELTEFGTEQSGELCVWEVEDTVLPDLLAGRPYEKGETNAIVIPKYLSTKVMADTDGAIPEEEIIDGEQFLGQVKEFEYYGTNPQTEEYEVLETLPLKVVGVYDNYKYFTLANECYAAPGTVTDLLIQQHNYRVELNAGQPGQLPDNIRILAYSDSIDNNMAIRSALGEVGLEVGWGVLYDQSGVDMRKVIGHYGMLFFWILFAVTVLASSMTMFLSVRSRRGELGLLKAVGYRNRNIWGMVVTEGILQCLVSLALAVLLTVAALAVTHWLVVVPNQFLNHRLFLSLSGQSVLIALAVSFGAPLLGIVASVVEAVRIPPTEALKEDG